MEKQNPGEGCRDRLLSGAGSPDFPGQICTWGMILDAFRSPFWPLQPQTHVALLPLSPSMGWRQAGDVGSQADKEPDPQPAPGLPAELGHLRAMCWVKALMGAGAVFLCSGVCSQSYV